MILIKTLFNRIVFAISLLLIYTCCTFSSSSKESSNENSAERFKIKISNILPRDQRISSQDNELNIHEAIREQNQLLEKNNSIIELQIREIQNLTEKFQELKNELKSFFLNIAKGFLFCILTFTIIYLWPVDSNNQTDSVNFVNTIPNMPVQNFSNMTAGFTYPMETCESYLISDPEFSRNCTDLVILQYNELTDWFNNAYFDDYNKLGAYLMDTMAPAINNIVNFTNNILNNLTAFQNKTIANFSNANTLIEDLDTTIMQNVEDLYDKIDSIPNTTDQNCTGAHSPIDALLIYSAYCQYFLKDFFNDCVESINVVTRSEYHCAGMPIKLAEVVINSGEQIGSTILNCVYFLFKDEMSNVCVFNPKEIDCGSIVYVP